MKYAIRHEKYVSTA